MAFLIKRFRFRFLFILFFVISFLFLCYLESPFNLRSFSYPIPSDVLIEDSWYAIYFYNNFIGYSHFFVRVQDIKNGGGYLIKNNLRLKIPVLGYVQPLSVDIEIKLLPNYRLNQGYFKIVSQNYFVKGIIKKYKKSFYFLSIKTPTSEIKKTISIKNEIVNSLFTPISLNYIPLKKKLVYFVYDPFLDKKIKIILKNKGKRLVKLENKERKVYEIEIDIEGIKCYILTDLKGRIIQEEILGFKLVRKDFHSIFEKDFHNFRSDLIQFFAIPGKCIPNKEKLSYLKIKIKGLSPRDIIEDFNQKVYIEDNGIIVEVYKKEPILWEDLDKIAMNREAFKEYLIENRFIKFNTLLVKNTVNSIVKHEKNSYIIIQKLMQWIDKNIKKVPTLSIPNTLDVLKMRQGDCGEISALFVGFLRSLGIPSYVNIGLVQINGKFFYHAWVSAYVGEWIDIDPALGQLIADPTHIKLFKGFKNQFEISKIIGNIQIEIIDYK